MKLLIQQPRAIGMRSIFDQMEKFNRKKSLSIAIGRSERIEARRSFDCFYSG